MRPITSPPTSPPPLRPHPKSSPPVLSVPPQCYNLRDWSTICRPARLGFVASASSLSEPTSYRDAVAHPEWQFAMAEEIAALERTGTWDLVPLSSSATPITCKWVYKIKTRSDGSIERY